MSMRTTITTHGGARVAVLDFTNITDDATALAVIAEARAVIAKEAPKSIYTLTDVTGSRVTPKIREALHQLTQANAPIVIAGSVVGLTTLQMVILRGIVQVTKRRLHPTKTRQEALDWIAEETKKG
jgi:hypothetical protein